MYGVEASQGVRLCQVAGCADEVLCYFGLIDGLPVLAKRLYSFTMFFR